jgi:hypothetical protein
MARSLFSIKGVLFTSTSNTEKTQGEIYDDIRSIEGVVTLNTRTLEKNKIAVVVKVDPYPFGSKFTQEVHDTIVKDIEGVKGVRKFRVKESPFVKIEPKQTFNPVPQSSKSYVNPPETSQEQR